MSEYKFTETAKEELDFECSVCGSTAPPELEDAERSDIPLVDWRVKTRCSECGNVCDGAANVWDRDVEKVNQSDLDTKAEVGENDG